MNKLRGKTVLITGASSGIGREIAVQLAAEGADLVLVARNLPALTSLASQLSHRHGIRTTVIAYDLTQPNCGLQLVQEMQEQGLTVDVLVNNAGFGSYGQFETLAAQAEQQQIAVNVAAVVDLCHAFLPGMLQRGSGVVLNLASTAAFQPAPYMAVYAATKAFVLSFSEALWAEYRQRGVHVVALCPGPVETPFIDRLGNPRARQTAVFAKPASAQQVAREALNAICGRAPLRIVGFGNWLMANSVRFAPRSWVARSAAGMLKPSES